MPGIVIKIGGSLAADREQLAELCDALSELIQKGDKIALVHGGGKDINANLELLEQKPKFVDGLRVTDEKVLDMVEMTLSGRVNKMLVRLLQKDGTRAVGISGQDGPTLLAKKKSGKPDLGFVGEVVEVRPELVQLLWQGGFLPIVSPISAGADGGSFNINADSAASALAVGLQAEQLVFLSDVPGVLKNGSVIPELNEKTVEDEIESGVISGGMIPKVQGCMDSVRSGVSRVHIAGWKGKNALVQQISGEENHGSIIRL